MKPKKFLKTISIATIFYGSIMVSTAEPASAFGWWKTDYLGRATMADNAAYWRSQGRTPFGTPPQNRDLICQWKYPRTNGTVYGQAAGWVGRASWETNCYHRYWKGWW
ncbi:hypothetical protein VB834_04625 [Limnoraphis robusta Tam1]|uniref:Uncharacterized protein n=1 Tax=Limnoraphis robusta CCNP1315 TaxID=3110306 RepID=A0ABU5TW58_9CYAN|nr:hypothetical protein [Limnoraphis robusta]MEA5519131.1 hypothetical protein [Limnoraphis robusta CCNP1315]MEA5538312.1 hypothetical protein [Limnoraphis robusta Tam1]MEA5548114.1 hypothetical protein [Limnoraphis robusta CCNP1324]